MSIDGVEPLSLDGEAGTIRPAVLPEAALRHRRIYRYAFGLTLATAISFGGDWPLFFLTPVLVAFMLALPVPGPSLREGAFSILSFLLAFGLGLGLTLLLLPFPLLFPLALGVVLFHSYYLLNRGGPMLLAVMTNIAVLLLPMLGLTHDVLAGGVAFYFAQSAVLAILLVLLAHGLIRDPVSAAARPVRPPMSLGYSAGAARAALKSTLVILPLATLFLTMNWSSELAVLIFSAMFSLAPDVSKGRAAALRSVVSTLVGGAGAVVFYGLLILMPEYHFLVILMLATSLLFGRGIFSNGALAPYLPSAMIALIVLVGGSMGENADITQALAVRVLLLTAATLYVVAALKWLDWLSRSWQRDAGSEGSAQAAVSERA